MQGACGGRPHAGTGRRSLACSRLARARVGRPLAAKSAQASVDCEAPIDHNGNAGAFGFLLTPRLLVRRSRHAPGVYQTGKERLNLGAVHGYRAAQAMESNEDAHPMDIYRIRM